MVVGFPRQIEIKIVIVVCVLLLVVVRAWITVKGWVVVCVYTNFNPSD